MLLHLMTMFVIGANLATLAACAVLLFADRIYTDGVIVTAIISTVVFVLITTRMILKEIAAAEHR